MFMLSLTGHSQNIDTDAVYELHIADGLVLDNQGSFGNGARVFIARRVEGKESQAWKLVKVSDNVYNIVNASSLRSLDNGNGNKMQPALQWTTDYGNANQQWIAKRLANGKFTFTCKASGMNLGMRDAAQFGEPVWQVAADDTNSFRQCKRNAERPGLPQAMAAHPFKPLYASQRTVEVPLVKTAGRPSRVFLQEQLRRVRVGQHRRPVLMGDERIRHSHLHQHNLSFQKQPSSYSIQGRLYQRAGTQSGRLVQAQFYVASGLDG